MHRTAESLAMPATTSQDLLTDVLRDGAQQLPAQAVEAEVTTWIESHRQIVDENGHRMVVRNGHMPTRTIVTGVGRVAVTRPRVHDRRIDSENKQGESLDSMGQSVDRFRSKILQP